MSLSGLKKWKEEHPEEVREAARQAASRHYYKNREQILADLRAKPKKPYAELPREKKDQLNEGRRIKRMELRLSNPDAYSGAQAHRNQVNIKDMSPAEFKAYKRNLWEAWAEKNKEKLKAYYAQKELTRKLTGYYRQPHILEARRRYREARQEEHYARLYPDIQADYELQNEVLNPESFFFKTLKAAEDLNNELKAIEISVSRNPRRYRLRA